MDWKVGDLGILIDHSELWYVSEDLVEKSIEHTLYRKIATISYSKRIRTILFGSLFEIIDPIEQITYVPSEHLYCILYLGLLKKLQ